jgi:hypothetical protein
MSTPTGCTTAFGTGFGTGLGSLAEALIGEARISSASSEAIEARRRMTDTHGHSTRDVAGWQAAHDLLLVVVGWNDTAATITSLTDLRGLL